MEDNIILAGRYTQSVLLRFINSARRASLPLPDAFRRFQLGLYIQVGEPSGCLRVSIWLAGERQIDQVAVLVQPASDFSIYKMICCQNGFENRHVFWEFTTVYACIAFSVSTSSGVVGELDKLQRPSSTVDHCRPGSPVQYCSVVVPAISGRRSTTPSTSPNPSGRCHYCKFCIEFCQLISLGHRANLTHLQHRWHIFSSNHK